MAERESNPVGSLSPPSTYFKPPFAKCEIQLNQVSVAGTNLRVA